MKTSSRKTRSVYRNQNALVRAVFERAGDTRKVLCVALDYAKRKHVALICDGQGDVLKASFPVENNAAGIACLTPDPFFGACEVWTILFHQFQSSAFQKHDKRILVGVIAGDPQFSLPRATGERLEAELQSCHITRLDFGLG